MQMIGFGKVHFDEQAYIAQTRGYRTGAIGWPLLAQYVQWKGRSGGLSRHSVIFSIIGTAGRRTPLAAALNNRTRVYYGCKLQA